MGRLKLVDLDQTTDPVLDERGQLSFHSLIFHKGTELQEEQLRRLGDTAICQLPLLISGL